MQSKESYEFKRKIKALSKLRGQGTELISIYMTPGYNINEMTAKLRDEAGQAMNIKSKQTKKNVTGAIERLLGAMRNMRRAPENGIVFFAGNLSRQSGGDKIEMFSIIPPEPVPLHTYRCDSTFYIEPLLEMLEPKVMYGLMTVDRREATIALLKGKRIDIIRTMGSQVPGKHRAGGQSSVRFERLIEIAAHEWFKKVGGIANDTFSPAKVEGVLVGGPGPTKHSFLSADYLNKEIKKKVVGTIDTGYTDEFGIRELVDKSGDITKELDITREKNLMREFIKEASIGGLAAYGEKEVRAAMMAGKIKVLLLSEEMEWMRYVMECPQCGSTAERTVKGELADAGKCEKCGTPMRISEQKEIVEDMVELAEQLGSSVEMISTDTPEGEQFLNGFGGIGALLRFK